MELGASKRNDTFEVQLFHSTGIKELQPFFKRKPHPANKLFIPLLEQVYMSSIQFQASDRHLTSNHARLVTD